MGCEVMGNLAELPVEKVRSWLGDAHSQGTVLQKLSFTESLPDFQTWEGDFPVPPSPVPASRFRVRKVRSRDGSGGFAAGFPAACPCPGPSGLRSRLPHAVDSLGNPDRG